VIRPIEIGEPHRQPVIPNLAEALFMRLAEELLLAPCRDEPAVSVTRLAANQQIACDAITVSLRPGAILLLAGNPGIGKTTVLHRVRDLTGGTLLGMRDFIDRLANRRPSAIEQVFLEVLEDTLILNDLVLVTICT
jgi:hypothetical protein